VPAVTVSASGSDVTATWTAPASGGSGAVVTSYAVVLERRRSDGTWATVTKAAVAADDRKWTVTVSAAGTYRVAVVATGRGGTADPTTSDPLVVA
jgi:hypothetical protein